MPDTFYQKIDQQTSLFVKVCRKKEDDPNQESFADLLLTGKPRCDLAGMPDWYDRGVAMAKMISGEGFYFSELKKKFNTLPFHDNNWGDLGRKLCANGFNRSDVKYRYTGTGNKDYWYYKKG